MVKVCHLTSVHPRYDARIYYKECKSLQEVGFEVTLIVADGLGNEFKEGIQILDVGKRKNKLKRFFFGTRDVYKKAISLNADIYHFHDPELIWFGVLLRKKNAKVIYDIHEDYYKQIFLKKEIIFPIRWTIAKSYKLLEVLLFHFYSALIVPQPSMISAYRRLNKNLELICNFVSIKPINKIEQIYPYPYIYHGGGLSKERGLLNMINSMEFVKTDIILIIAGSISNILLNEVKNLKGWERVKYVGLLSHEESMSYYANSEMGLILYNNVGQYYLSYSIKLFEYMRYGKPVIMPDFGEWVKFNAKNNCGINVNVNNPMSVAKQIDMLMEKNEVKEHLGNNGKQSIEKEYNWPSEAKKLVNLYNNLIETNLSSNRKSNENL
ncbi:MAG TPA: glycosyltransferase [Verrucomicrobiae bacterium]|nr:glycosyltransferase [Verrucomicrobiae bacterium]